MCISLGKCEQRNNRFEAEKPLKELFFATVFSGQFAMLNSGA